jgi:hypothetical protein
MEYAMKYDALGAGVMTPLGAGRKHSRVTVTDTEVTVQQGWAFRASVPREAVKGAKRLDRTYLSRGAHGWAGRWLVNGAGDNLVSITIDPAGRGFVIGFPVKLRELIVSVDDPDALVAGLQPA